MVDLKEFEQKAADLRVLGMKISIGQDTVYEKYWDEDCRRNIYSASKSFTSCAVGFAVQEGLIDLDERLMDAFKEDIPNNPDENLKKATVKDLDFRPGKRLSYGQTASKNGRTELGKSIPCYSLCV